MNNRMPDFIPCLVAIDLDGTMVDTAPDLHASINEMLRLVGREQQSLETIESWMGNGIERLVHRALTGEFNNDSDPSLFNEAFPYFIQAYKQFNGTLSRLYPGVSDALASLAQTDRPLVCITNKAAAFTEPLMHSLAIHSYFNLVIAGDTLAQKKPHPAQLLHASQHFAIDSAECALIGDSISDIRAARAAKFRVVCMSYGYNHGVSLDTLTGEEQPDLVLDCLLDLPFTWFTH